MTDDPKIGAEMSEMQMIMLDILRRRAVMEALEERAIEAKVMTDDIILTIYASDYLRQQLSDLRKFFDGKDPAYQVSNLTSKLSESDGVAIQKYTGLHTRWNDNFKKLADKYFFHRDRNYTPPNGLSRHMLDAFINDTNIFLDDLVKELTKKGFVVEYVMRQFDTSYFQDVKASAHDFFKKL